MVQSHELPVWGYLMNFLYGIRTALELRKLLIRFYELFVRPLQGFGALWGFL